MKTLLVLAPTTSLAEALRATLDPGRYRVLNQAEMWQAEPLLRSGSADGCVLEADLTDVQAIRLVEQIRRVMPVGPILVYAGQKQREWEEEAYLLGVTYVLEKPVRGRLLNALLDRVWQHQNGESPPTLPASAPPEVQVASTPAGPTKSLETLTEFSSILTHALSSEELVKRFLLVFREVQPRRGFSEEIAERSDAS
jgi:DNA-binding NtrC family response regulator